MMLFDSKDIKAHVLRGENLLYYASFCSMSLLKGFVFSESLQSIPYAAQSFEECSCYWRERGLLLLLYL